VLTEIYGKLNIQIQALFSFYALWDPKCLQVSVTGAPTLFGICQGDMFRPNKSSSGPSRTQIRALFSFSALWDLKCLQVSVTGAPALFDICQGDMFRPNRS
jgi:hypothetical protein